VRWTGLGYCTGMREESHLPDIASYNEETRAESWECDEGGVTKPLVVHIEGTALTGIPAWTTNSGGRQPWKRLTQLEQERILVDVWVCGCRRHKRQRLHIQPPARGN
jgi:hypothetical protein